MYFFLSDKHINTKPIPVKGDVTAFSSASQYYGRIRFRGFSLKYVFSGTERYVINGKKYEVGENEFLLANHCSEGNVEIDSTNAVKGLCVDLDSLTLQEILDKGLQELSDGTIVQLQNDFHSKNFEPVIYSADQNQLGQFLKSYATHFSLRPNEDYQLERGFYFELAQHLIENRLAATTAQNEPYTKRTVVSTVDIKRLISAKNYIDNCFAEEISVPQIATEASMSEFTFFRKFKMLFNESPYKYILSKRLLYAHYMLRTKDCSVSEVAAQSGFSDIYSFSRSFKQFYKEPPSSVLLHKKVIHH
jgi:AraC-like DNA-binding protein